MLTNTKSEITKPSGPAMAAILSASLGCFAIGLMIVISEASKKFSDWLNWWNPGGPLVGKTGMGIVVWLLSWLILSIAWGKKEVQLKPAAIAAFVLVALAFLLSFPPVFDLFAPE